VTDPFRDPRVRALVRLALAEDVGRGDATTIAIIPPARQARARIEAREAVIVAGLPIAPVLFEEHGAEAEIDIEVIEGERAAKGATLASIDGSASSILEVERTLLNFLQRMCGIATLTRRYVEAIRGTTARIVDTRKTIPGWRALDKYAVRVGGGTNHRFGLDDGILIKDNHLAAAGGVARAIERARCGAPHHLMRIEVECETLEDVAQAIAGRVDAILLDNMDLDTMREAVRRARAAIPAIVIEASGGITLERARPVAETGVDLISVGALTHSAPAADLSLELEPG
jgi:nicotinate-nucleotide pyrophosphorylase (carboxylating)